MTLRGEVGARGDRDVDSFFGLLLSFACLDTIGLSSQSQVTGTAAASSSSFAAAAAAFAAAASVDGKDQRAQEGQGEKGRLAVEPVTCHVCGLSAVALCSPLVALTLKPQRTTTGAAPSSPPPPSASSSLTASAAEGLFNLCEEDVAAAPMVATRAEVRMLTLKGRSENGAAGGVDEEAEPVVVHQWCALEVVKEQTGGAPLGRKSDGGGGGAVGGASGASGGGAGLLSEFKDLVEPAANTGRGRTHCLGTDHAGNAYWNFAGAVHALFVHTAPAPQPPATTIPDAEGRGSGAMKMEDDDKFPSSAMASSTQQQRRCRQRMSPRRWVRFETKAEVRRLLEAWLDPNLFPDSDDGKLVKLLSFLFNTVGGAGGGSNGSVGGGHASSSSMSLSSGSTNSLTILAEKPPPLAAQSLSPAARKFAVGDEVTVSGAEWSGVVAEVEWVADSSNGEWSYRVSYPGWGARCDEWVCGAMMRRRCLNSQDRSSTMNDDVTDEEDCDAVVAVALRGHPLQPHAPPPALHYRWHHLQASRYVYSAHRSSPANTSSGGGSAGRDAASLVAPLAPFHASSKPAPNKNGEKAAQGVLQRPLGADLQKADLVAVSPLLLPLLRRCLRCMEAALPLGSVDVAAVAAATEGFSSDEEEDEEGGEDKAASARKSPPGAAAAAAAAAAAGSNTAVVSVGSGGVHTWSPACFRRWSLSLDGARSPCQLMACVLALETAVKPAWFLPGSNAALRGLPSRVGALRVHAGRGAAVRPSPAAAAAQRAGGESRHGELQPRFRVCAPPPTSLSSLASRTAAAAVRSGGGGGRKEELAEVVAGFYRRDSRLKDLRQLASLSKYGNSSKAARAESKADSRASEAKAAEVENEEGEDFVGADGEGDEAYSPGDRGGGGGDGSAKGSRVREGAAAVDRNGI
eukprot:CAMPEP_0171764266 /NCGR_PEP_ID=MMETSP0991-20121206/49883_1 /TAXON_ID=483369 /ORGANISM="non described non described, Strain CCMP2098" /LENGTH=912 /DNA_ID=CAMNT_0012368355 /DNA_START=44 /DNA_END=2785 /DNA_ORIENTATION=+